MRGFVNGGKKEARRERTIRGVYLNTIRKISKISSEKSQKNVYTSFHLFSGLVHISNGFKVSGPERFAWSVGRGWHIPGHADFIFVAYE